MNRILLMVMICSLTSLSDAATYGTARIPTPVLNTPAFSKVFGGRDNRVLKTDRCGQVRELEFIALPGTVFKLLGEIRNVASLVYRVETGDYPAPAGRPLYLDSRFIELSESEPLPRLRKLPAIADIIAALKAASSSPYVWGGNIRQGVPELPGMFYRNDLTDKEHNKIKLAGVDCSGLLYQATNGWTPRNTAQLVDFGKGVAVAGKTIREVAKLLQPLDLIVWTGHVVIVLDHETVIESRLECGKPGNGGVRTTALVKRLGEIMQQRRPMDVWPVDGIQGGMFVVRRWLEP
jgi:hypothetical protein